MEIHESITENSSDSFLIVRKRKPRFEIEGEPKELKISTESNFVSMQKIAHAYAKDYSPDQNQLEAFKKIGVQIGKDFQFLDKGSGANTLAGQIENNVTENRDCKLPTFLLATTWNEVYGANQAKIVYLNANLAHPYVQTNTDGKDSFGHFVKPRFDDLEQLTRFELLTEKQMNGLKNSLDISGGLTFDTNLEGMIGIDELFLKV